MRSVLHIFILALVIVSFSCKKKEDKPEEPAPITPTVPTGLNANSSRYVKFSLASQSYSYSPPPNGVWSISSGGLQTSPTMPYYYSTYTTHNAASYLFIGISDSTRVIGPVSDDFFKSFVSVKSYSFAKKNYQGVGVFISLTNPADSTYYSTVNTVNNTSFQNGSSFNIGETFYHIPNGSSYLQALYKATINCKLYNSTGDSIQLTNGEVVSTLSKF